MFGWIGTIFKTAIQQDELPAYYYISYNSIGRLYDAEMLALKLQERFTRVKTLVRIIEGDIQRISEIKSVVPEILFKADNLYATISPTRAVLFQKSRAPFTLKDLELRKTIFNLYNSRFTLPIFDPEPKFEILVDEIRNELVNFTQQDPRVQEFIKQSPEATVQTILSDPEHDRWIVIWQSTPEGSDQQHLYVAVDQSRGRIQDVSKDKEEMMEN
jgi:hypothetical protein